MRRRLAVCVVTIAAAVAVATVAARAAGPSQTGRAPRAAPVDVPTYSKDIAPILQQTARPATGPERPGRSRC